MVSVIKVLLVDRFEEELQLKGWVTLCLNQTAR